MDELTKEAAEIVRKTGRASISNIQRHLRIGYVRAARIMDELEEMGVVSPMQKDYTRIVILPQEPRS